MVFESKIESVKEYSQVFPHLEELLKRTKIVLLKGDLGAGKTTFVQSYCKHKGVEGHVNSPTFGLINEYTHNGDKIYHFDLYRIEDEEELYDIGFEEYIDSGSVCFIEWPEKADNIIVKPFILLNLLVEGSGRFIRLSLEE